MAGSHLSRGSHQRRATPRTTTLSARPYNAEKHEEKRVAEGWPEVEGSFSIRRRFRFCRGCVPLALSPTRSITASLSRSPPLSRPRGLVLLLLLLVLLLPRHPRVVRKSKSPQTKGRSARPGSSGLDKRPIARL